LLSVKKVQSFLRFANFYHKFIQGYSDLVQLLTELIYKDKKFEWFVKAKKTFCRLKKIFVTALALAQFDYNKKTQIKTDLSK
jgi:hypothetical protein